MRSPCCEPERHTGSQAQVWHLSLSSLLLQHSRAGLKSPYVMFCACFTRLQEVVQGKSLAQMIQDGMRADDGEVRDTDHGLVHGWHARLDGSILTVGRHAENIYRGEGTSENGSGCLRPTCGH